MNYAKQIAQSLYLDENDIDLACCCELFHDIARFKQWDLYETFHDALSFDHGDEGYNILKELNINNNIILNSTKYHNKYSIDESLDERCKMFANITRDADKIDILLTQYRDFNDNTFRLDERVLNAFKEKKLVKNDLSLTDNQLNNLLRGIAFIFDINYKKSFEILRKTDEINHKFNMILKKIDNEEIKKLKDFCNKYMEERLG